jgi:CheY-like chemotaxis protein
MLFPVIMVAEKERLMSAQPVVPSGTFPDQEERTPTLLVVDDETLIRAVLSDYLQECGYKVLEASTGEEAILILGRAEVIIDLVFTDVTMPGSVDGFALSKWVRLNRPDLQL